MPGSETISQELEDYLEGWTTGDQDREVLVDRLAGLGYSYDEVQDIVRVVAGWLVERRVLGLD